MFPNCDPHNLPCNEQAQIKAHMKILRGVVELHVDAKLHHKHKRTKVDTHTYIQQQFGKVSNTIRSSNTLTKAPSESLNSMKHDVSGTCEPNSNKIATTTAQTFVLQPAPSYFNVKLASIQPHFSAPAKLNPLSSVFVPTTCICMRSQQVVHTEMEVSPPATSRKLAPISTSYTTPPRRSNSSATRTKAATGTTRSRNLNNNSRTSHWQRVLQAGSLQATARALPFTSTPDIMLPRKNAVKKPINPSPSLSRQQGRQSRSKTASEYFSTSHNRHITIGYIRRIKRSQKKAARIHSARSNITPYAWFTSTYRMFDQ